MRLAIPIAGVLASLAVVSPALAQPGLAQPAPAPTPARCDVHVLRSPEPVRLVVEARLRREPRCATSLVVRIVPTSTGLYLLAHTPVGHTYEMIVPDAEIAAELIATWAVRRDPAAPPAPLPPLAPPAIAPPPVDASPALSSAPAAGVEASHEVPRVRPPGITPETPPGAPARGAMAGQWLSMSGIAGAEVFGVRGELDLWSKGGWSGGVAVAYTVMDMVNVSGSAALEFGDLRGMVTAGHTLGRGALRLRGQVAVGVVRTELAGVVDGFGPISYAGAHPIGEASAQLHVMLGRGRVWALSGGPTLTVYAQTFELSNGTGMQAVERSFDVSFVGGLRRRL